MEMNSLSCVHNGDDAWVLTACNIINNS